MRAKKYILSMAMVYMAYFTHGIQAIILSQNKVNFFTQWGYTDEVAGAAAVSLAITATGFGKFLTVWLGGCRRHTLYRVLCWPAVLNKLHGSMRMRIPGRRGDFRILGCILISGGTGSC